MIHLAAALILGCTGPQPSGDPFDNTVPKYGDPSYQTIWSRNSGAQRLRWRNESESIEVHPMIYETWSALEHYRGRLDLAEQYAGKARHLRDGK